MQKACTEPRQQETERCFALSSMCALMEGECNVLPSASHLPFSGSANSPTILQWWSEREAAFPQIAVVARMLLAVPATSALSERVFSYAGFMSSGRRASISSKVLQACVRDRGIPKGKHIKTTIALDTHEEEEEEGEDE